MNYKFVILSDEIDDFRRDILIDSDATFFELHEAILESVGYTKDQMTSFFICDEDWMKEKEITLVEMDTSSEEDSYVMEATRLSDLIEDEKQKLLYIFEYLTERSFFMELREIVTGKSQPRPECVYSKGNPPVQTTEFEALDEKLNARIATSTNHHLDDDLYEDDDDLGMDDYDEEDLDNLSEGNPFDDY
jgi:hypothetical protein